MIFSDFRACEEEARKLSAPSGIPSRPNPSAALSSHEYTSLTRVIVCCSNGNRATTKRTVASRYGHRHGLQYVLATWSQWSLRRHAATLRFGLELSIEGFAKEGFDRGRLRKNARTDPPHSIVQRSRSLGFLEKRRGKFARDIFAKDDEVHVLAGINRP